MTESKATAYAVLAPRNAQTDLLAIEGLFSGLHQTNRTIPVAFEVWGEPTRLRLIIRSPHPEYAEFAANRLRSVWPQAVIQPLYDSNDPAYILERAPHRRPDPLVYEMRFREPAYLPIRTHISREGRSSYDDLARQADPFVEVLTALSQLKQDEYAAVQYAIRPVNDAWGRLWRGSGQDVARRLAFVPPYIFRPLLFLLASTLAMIGALFLIFALFSPSALQAFVVPVILLALAVFVGSIVLRIPPPPDPEIVSQKIGSSGFIARVRLFVWASPAREQAIMSNLVASFGGYGFPAGNTFVARHIQEHESILDIVVPFSSLNRNTLFVSSLFSSRWQLPILTAAELAYMWHLPHESVYVPKLEYTSSKMLTPTSRDFFDESGVLIGNDPLTAKAIHLPMSSFRSHIGLIGASQSGKTNMMVLLTSALLTLEPEASFVVIDPHGTLARGLLNHIPRSRLNKTFYIDLGNTDHSIGLNLIDQSDRSSTDAFVESKLLSDVVSSLRQIWTDSWGPRMEDYLRGALTILIAANQMLLREHAWVAFARQFVEAARRFLQAATPVDRQRAYNALLGTMSLFPKEIPGSSQARAIAEKVKINLSSLLSAMPAQQQGSNGAEPQQSIVYSMFQYREMQRQRQNGRAANNLSQSSQSASWDLLNINSLAEIVSDVERYLGQIANITNHILTSGEGGLNHEVDPFLFAYVTRTTYSLNGTPAVRARPIQFTILDVPAFLMHDRFMNLVVSLLNNVEHPHALDWVQRNVFEIKKELMNTYREYITPVITKINAFVTYVQARRILGQSESTLSIRSILDGGGVLIINLASGVIGRDAADLIGSTIINQIAAHLFARQRNINKEISGAHTRPRPLYLAVDEFQTISGGNFAMLLSETAKFGLRLIMGTQSLMVLRQRRDDRYIPWLENVRTLFCYRVSSEDAQIAKEFNLAGGESSLRISEEDLVGLPDYNCVVRAHDTQGRPSVFVIRTKEAIPPAESVQEGFSRMIVTQSINALHRPGHEIDMEVSSFAQHQSMSVLPVNASIEVSDSLSRRGRRSSSSNLFGE